MNLAVTRSRLPASRNSVARLLALGAILLGGVRAVATQAAISGGPPMPYEDVGACPFEGCVYRTWIANAPVAVFRDRDPGSEVVFTVKKGQRVRAVTGIVVTFRPGRVEFRQPADLQTPSGTLHIEPGETLYLLTYHGEGSTTAWFKGRWYDEVDGSGFLNALCDIEPSRCTGVVVEKPQSVWWVRVESMEGLKGWTREPGKFDNKDALGGLEPLATEPFSWFMAGRSAHPQVP